MKSCKYIVSLTTIPSRIDNIDKTIESLINQTLKPDKIVLNIPVKYNLRFTATPNDSVMQELENRYGDDLTINYVDYDYGPGTKLMGAIKNNIIDVRSDNEYIVLVDDDHIYEPVMIQYFDNYNRKHCGGKLKAASFYCYAQSDIVIGQGADGFFINSNVLGRFEDYYDIIRIYDYIKYHDDYYISHYLHVTNISPFHLRLPYQEGIYSKHSSWDIDGLVLLQNEHSRTNLNENVNKILKELEQQGKFDKFNYAEKIGVNQLSGLTNLTINNNNCQLITTTLSNNRISELRKKNISDNLEINCGFDVIFIEGISTGSWGKVEQYVSTLNMLEHFKKSTYEYGIICQDDFFPINNFLQELNKTVELLPNDWECLHLCPGFLWGRKFRNRSKIGHLNPEYYMEKSIFDYHASGRFFINCNAQHYYDHNMWLGGPVAFIVKKIHVSNIIKKYKENFDHDDRSLVKILDDNTFICREPQLGYEEECGGTSIM